MYCQQIIGIELGSGKSVISKITKNGIENVDSLASNKEIPFIFSYSNKERHFSEQALAIVKGNYKNSFFYIMNVQGLIDKDEEQYMLTQFEEVNDRYLFSVEYLNQTIKLQAEQILASYIQGIKKLIEAKQQTGFYSCLSVPSYFEVKQLKNVQNALKIANFSYVKVIPEHTAIAYAYLWQNKQNLIQNKENFGVLFIDVGQTKSSIIAINFQQLSAQIKFVSCEKFGVRDIDNILFQFFIQEFKKQFNEDFPIQNKKLRLRIMDVIEKQRTILSANADTQIYIESLYNDQDFQLNFTKQQLEDLVLEKLQEKFGNQLIISKYILSDLNFVIQEIELMGGGIRIPIIKRFIQEQFVNIRIVSSMNVSSISRGCAVQSAILVSLLNPLIRIDPYHVENVTSKEITIQQQDQPENKRIIPKNSKIPQSIEFIVQKSNNPFIFVDILYNQKQEIGIEIEIDQQNTIFQNLVILLELQDDETITVKKIESYKEKVQEEQQQQQNNFSNEQQQQQQPSENIQNEKKIEENANNEQQLKNENDNDNIKTEKQMEIEEKKQDLKENNQNFNEIKENINIQIKFQIHYFREQDTELIKQFTYIEANMSNNDNNLQSIINQRNQLEKLIYESKEIIQEQLGVLLNQVQINELITKVQEIRVWSEENFQCQDLNQIKQKYLYLLSIIQPFKKQILQKMYNKIPVQNLDQLKHISDQFKNKEIECLQLNFRNQNLTDGSGYLGMFKKGAAKLSQLLSTISVSKRLEIDIGNNSLSDEGVKYIIDSIKNFKYLQEISIDFESVIGNKLENKITQRTFTYLSQLLQLLSELEVIQLYFNRVSSDELLSIEDAVINKHKLKHLKVSIKNGQIDKEISQFFVEKLKNKQNIVKFEFDYYNEKGQKENL